MASEAELLQKIKDLEAKLEEYDSTMSLFSEAERRMIRIIGKEMERLEKIVQVDTFNEEELEKFIYLADDPIDEHQMTCREQHFYQYLGPGDGISSERVMREIEKFIEDYQRKKKKDIDTQRRVLFFSFYGSWLVHNQVDAVIASALRLRGCEVTVVGCNGIYGKDCCILRYVPDSQKVAVCKSCEQTGRQFFNISFQLPYIQLQNFIVPDDYKVANQWIETIKPEDYANAFYDNIPIGEWVTSSIYTHFRITPKSLSKPDIQSVHKQYLIDGLITYKAVHRIIDTLQPTHLFIFNARFLPYRIAFEAAQQRQIDVIVHERGFIGDSFSFRDNYICTSYKPLLTYVDEWEIIPLVQAELNQVKNYFRSRETGKNLSWPSFYDFKTDYDDIRHRLRIPHDAKIVAVFTSSEDELAMSDEHQGISEQLDIISRLIEIFAGREEYLVIRHHPNIGGQKIAGMIAMAETDFLSRAYHQALSLPKNVRIVMPNEQLTSYALLWNASASIAFFSTIAVESCARGLPTSAFKFSPYHKALRHIIKETDLESLENWWIIY